MLQWCVVKNRCVTQLILPQSHLTEKWKWWQKLNEWINTHQQRIRNESTRTLTLSHSFTWTASAFVQVKRTVHRYTRNWEARNWCRSIETPNTIKSKDWISKSTVQYLVLLCANEWRQTNSDKSTQKNGKKQLIMNQAVSILKRKNNSNNNNNNNIWSQIDLWKYHSNP